MYLVLGWTKNNEAHYSVCIRVCHTNFFFFCYFVQSFRSTVISSCYSCAFLSLWPILSYGAEIVCVVRAAWNWSAWNVMVFCTAQYHCWSIHITLWLSEKWGAFVTLHLTYWMSHIILFNASLDLDIGSDCFYISWCLNPSGAYTVKV